MHDNKLAQYGFRAWIGLQTKVPIESKPLEPLGGSLTHLMDFKLYLVNIITSPYLSDVNQQKEIQEKSSNTRNQLELHMQSSFECITKTELVYPQNRDKNWGKLDF